MNVKVGQRSVGAARVIGALLVALLAACGGTQTGTSGSAEPVTIGLLQSYQGGLASYGVGETQGAQFFADQINQKGGINGHRLQFVTADDQTDPRIVVQQLQGLIDNAKVIGIFGPSGSATAVAAKPIAEDQKIVLLSTSGAVALTNPPANWYFRATLTNDQNAQVVLNFLGKTKGAKRIAVIRADDSFGQSGVASFKKFAAQFGVSIVSDVAYPPDATNMTTQVTTARSSNPDAYIVWDSSARLPTVLKNLRDQGVTSLPIVGPSNTGLADTIKVAGDAVNGVYGTGQLAVDDPRPGTQKSFVDAWKAKHNGGPPDDATMFGYAGMELVYRAVKSVLDSNKKLTRQTLRDALEETRDYDTVFGHVTYGPGNHDPLPLSELQLIQVKNGMRLRAA